MILQTCPLAFDMLFLMFDVLKSLAVLYLIFVLKSLAVLYLIFDFVRCSKM